MEVCVSTFDYKRMNVKCSYDKIVAYLSEQWQKLRSNNYI